LQVLEQARKETARGMMNWLKTVEEDTTYTIQQHRALLGQLDRAIKTLQHELFPATLRDLKNESVGAMNLSGPKLQAMITAGEKKFGTVVPLKIDLSTLISDESKWLVHRHASSAARYANRTGRQIQNQLAVGTIKNETVGQLVRRLGRITMSSESRMTDSTRADAVARDQFFRSEADAERLVRTETVHAYNSLQDTALDDANREVGGDGGWLKKWDAVHDRRTCYECAAVDGEIVDAGANFSCGVPYPPLHPCDRCTVVPWRPEWGV
jgi:hypothetical protein